MEMTQEEMKRNLQEAKSSAKKLIEKIYKYLESLKPEFKKEDIVASKIFTDDSISFVQLNQDLTNRLTSVEGLWYSKRDCDIVEASYGVFKEDTRHATPEEIAEYEVALTFHKHGRKPFEIKEGDILRYGESDGKNFLVKGDTIFLRKQDFIDGKLFFLKTYKEVNELLGVDDE